MSIRSLLTALRPAPPPDDEVIGNVTAVDTIIYFRLDNTRAIGFRPTPIHNADQKAKAKAAALKTISLTWDTTRLVLFVCDPTGDRRLPQEWLHELKQVVDGTALWIDKPRYWENASGEGFAVPPKVIRIGSPAQPPAGNEG
jgi:hypothetical protein